MSDMIRCPDCGRQNEPGNANCAGCNYPLADDKAPAAAAGPAAKDAPRPVRPLRRPKRRQRGMDSQSMTLWLMFAVIAAGALLYLGIRSNVERASEPIAGSDEHQQEHADEFRAALERDSTDVQARIGLANIYYDTGNWLEAASHYTRAVAQDSSQIGALVDLGVCYYNMGRTEEAERRFQLALVREPHHSIALFNLGIVNERRDRPAEAMEYYHRCLQTEPPEDLRQTLMAAMARLQQQTGRGAPAIPEGG